jgi:ribose-phosphate pyrophosphokinase
MVPVLVGQPWSGLTQEIAQRFNTSLIPITVAQFADTETFVSVKDYEKTKDKDVLLIYQLSRVKVDAVVRSIQQSSINDQLMAVFELVDLLKLFGTRSISVVLPYFPYSRQDESVCKKYQGAVFMLGRCFKGLGVAQLAVCDLHAPSVVDSYPMKLMNIPLEHFWHNVIAEHIIAGNPKYQYCFVSPDKGGEDRVKKLAALFDISYAVIHKMRVAPDTAVSYDIVGDVYGKQAILIDDIVDTARTAHGACELLLSKGALHVYGCFTHAVLSAGASERLLESKFEKVFVTDSIVGGSLDHIKKLHIISLNGWLANSIVEWWNRV